VKENAIGWWNPIGGPMIDRMPLIAAPQSIRLQKIKN